jgi:DNA polymerase (family 10)
MTGETNAGATPGTRTEGAPAGGGPPVGQAAPVDKAAVAQVLREMSMLLQAKGENPFKVRAYDVGAERIAGLQEDLGRLVAEGRLTELQGIGKALADKVSELVTTGRLGAHEELKREFPPGLTELLKVPDLGPKKLLALWQSLGVGDVDGLERACREGRVRGVKGFGEKSEARILAGVEVLRRATEGAGRRRLGDVLPVAQELLAHVRELPGVVRASLAGSVRRGAETVGDVDLLASAPDARAVLEALTRHPKVAQVLGSGGTKASVRLAHTDLQVDLRVLPDEDFATALHHFTGSKGHHLRLRHLARERGLTVSEWGVFRDDGVKLPVPDEAALYALLGMPYIPPELREDTGEVEAALAGTLPADLLEAADVAGVVHSHSTWSDGRNTLEEMALAARALGLRYLTATEHSQAAIYAGGMTLERLERQWAEIDALNARLEGVRILKGIEVDILEDGALDFPAAVLERLDVVIGSIHVRHSMDEEQMTRRVLRALDAPHLHILGHPTGRLIQERDPFPLRMEEVLDRAAERGVAVEVNGNPHRLDLKAEHVRMAVQRGVRLVVSSDSHSTLDVANVRYAVATARRGWARRRDVLNTLDAEAFTRSLRARGG